MKKQVMLGIFVGTAIVTPVSFNQPSENHAIVTLNSADAKDSLCRRAVLLALNEGRGDGSSARLNNCQFRRRTLSELLVTALGDAHFMSTRPNPPQGAAPGVAFRIGEKPQ